MPLPCTTLEELKRRYAEEMPDATHEQHAEHERFAKQILDKNKKLSADKAPWLSGERFQLKKPVRQILDQDPQQL